MTFIPRFFSERLRAAIGSLLTPSSTGSAASILAPVLLLAAGCGPKARPESPVLMICVDGLEISVVESMLEKESLPNLAALIDRGICGSLRTIAPAESPVIWSTVATGKDRETHGITGFTDPKSNGPFTSNARRGKALWNITDDCDLSCNLVGYWITWPAEKIRGVVVSQFSSESQIQAQLQKKGTLYSDLDEATWPPDYIDTIRPLVEQARRRENLVESVVNPVFGDLNALQPPVRIQDLVSSSYWSFEADAVYHAVARRLFSEQPADLNIVYYGGSDVIGHRFWRYREPELYTYPILDKYIEAFGESIERYYGIVDRMIGELVSLFPPETRIIVLSDHGMHADFLDGTVDGKPMPLSAHHLDGPPGLLVAAGKGIRKGEGVSGVLKGRGFTEIATVFDIAPTVLYLLDMPVGRDMRFGRVLKDVLTLEQRQSREVEYVDTHDEGFRPPTRSIVSEEADEEFKERFRELGYF